MKILVADDDPINRKYLRSLLGHEGHTVIECADGLATLALLEEHRCDVLISDILMPQMDGYRLCYEIRKHKKLKNTPIVLYSATYTSVDDEKAALAMGADKFIRKPAQPEVIVNALNEVVENRRAGRADKPKKRGDLSALRKYSEVLVRKLEETNIGLTVANEALSENARRLRTIIESEPECVKVLARDGTLLEMNPAGLRMIEAASAGEVVGTKVDALVVPGHRRAFQELNEAVFRGESGVLEFEIIGLKGTRRWLDTHAVPLRNAGGDIVATLAITRDITERKHNAQLLNDQMRVLEMIATGARLNDTLDSLLRVLEAHADDMLCSIQLLDADGVRLKHAAAPRLPEEYSRRIDGVAIGEGIGSCGTAAFRRTPVMVQDIATDVLWKDYRELALRHGLRACWATPIFDPRRNVLGTFAIYFREPRVPTERHARLVEIATHIAAIAIHKDREEQALRESEERFREMADNAPVMIWLAGADGSCVYLNRRWREFTGLPDEAALGYGWLDSVHPDDRQRITEGFQKAKLRCEPFRQEYRMRRFDGVYRWMIDSASPRVSESGDFLGYVGSVLDISERKQAEDERQRNLERVRALHEINLAITSEMDLQSRLDILLEQIEKIFPRRIISTLRLLRPDTGELEYLAFRGVDKDQWLTEEPGRRLRRAWQVIETKAPVIVDDLRNTSLHSNDTGLARLGLVSYAGVPLIARDQVLGVLAVYTQEKHEFEAEEIDFLTALAGQAAIAIHNAQLYEEAERRRHEAEELARIARSLTETLDLKAVGERVVASVLGLFRVKGASLRLRRPDGSMHRFVSAGEIFSQTPTGAVIPARVGLADRAFSEGKAVWSANILDDPRIELNAEMREHVARSGNGSMITVPLRAHENAIGILTLSDRTGRRYSQDEINLLQAFADQVALALENARLYEQTEHSLKRLEALRAIDQAITSTLDLSSVLQLLLEKIDVFLPPHAATTIRLFNRSTGRFENTACRNIEEQAWKKRVGYGTRSRSDELLRTKRPIYIANMQEETGLSAAYIYREYGFVSYLGVPLIAKDNVVGVLGIYTKTAHEFAQQEIDFLLTLAGQAAIAIQNARLYEDIERSKRELETTNRSLESSLKKLESFYAALTPLTPGSSNDEIMRGIIDRLIEATGADAALVRVWDPGSRSYKIVSQSGYPEPFLEGVVKLPPGGSADWVVRHGEPIIAPDITLESRFRGKVQLTYGFRSSAMLPLLSQDDVRGMLQISSRTLGHFREEQKEHLMAVARQTSIALENRRLFNEVITSRDELERANIALSESNRMLSALHAVAAAASQSINLNRILDSAIEKITEIFNFETTRIHLRNEQTGEIVRRAVFEKNPERFPQVRSFRPGQGIIGNVVASGQPLIFADVETDPRYRELSQTKVATQSRNRFFAVFPIRSKFGVIGTLSCLGSEPRKLTPSEIQLLEALADQLAVAIENAGLYEAVNLKVDELQRKTTELEQANRIKDEFLGVVSHELRTPINVLMGYTSLFKDGVFGELKPAQEEALTKIAREAKDLLAMINTLLYATTLETDSGTLDVQEFSASELMAELRANYAVTIPPQITMHWRYPAKLPALNTDRRKLRQILDNLIGNAAKFTEQGDVTVAVTLPEKTRAEFYPPEQQEADPFADPWIEFSVTDTGVGIPPDRLAKIFDKFYQVDSTETRRYGGVGMGLYIAKKFAELLGGSITVESVEGKGSKFTLAVPCRLAAASARPASSESQWI